MKRRTNKARAWEGEALCRHMHRLTGVDNRRDQVSDILCHMMHLCRMIQDEKCNSIDFEDCLASARINFEAECNEDPDE